jgi:hypothetical protein
MYFLFPRAWCILRSSLYSWFNALRHEFNLNYIETSSTYLKENTARLHDND